MRTDIKLVIEFVPFANLTDMQKKLNQWITTGLLVKFKSQATEQGVLYEIIVRKA
jgi:hypothetical protein